jgi:hypothetical protein
VKKEEWKTRVLTLGEEQSLAGFLTGPYSAVCQGQLCPVGYLLFHIDEHHLREQTGIFSLHGPYHDEYEGDVFFGVNAYWIDEDNWLLDSNEKSGVCRKRAH